jgi:hypothetical protein
MRVELPGQKFLTINRNIVVPELPYSPDLSAADFCCSETGN